MESLFFNLVSLSHFSNFRHAFSVYIMSEHYAHLQLLYSISMNSVLSPGSRNCVGPCIKTREKVCVWCVFESHTHSVSVLKLSHWYCFEKWCPGAESNHRHEDFQSPDLSTGLPAFCIAVCRYARIPSSSARGAVRQTSSSISNRLRPLSMRYLRNATRREQRHGLAWKYCELRVIFVNWKDCKMRRGLRRTSVDCACA